MIDIKQSHVHVWTKSLDGTEFANIVYDNDVDAALSFLSVARQITFYNEEANITIEDASNSIQNGH
jgi:hypothetical protein